MQYKEQIKENELITKIRIIRYVKREHIPVGAVATSFSCHRNTIGNIIRMFEQDIAEEAQQFLLYPPVGGVVSVELLRNKFTALLNQKRIPKSNKRSADKTDEEAIVALYTDKKIKVGMYRMHHTLERRFGKGVGLANLTPGQIRGIYKRNNLRQEKSTSATGERRHLYDYQAIACFEFMHLDVKYVLDKHALPEDIYELLSHNDAPIFQWNLIEVKTRTRFLAYSYGL